MGIGMLGSWQSLAPPFTPLEEVEIEAKVKGHEGKLTSVVVKVRNKPKNGQLLAIGTQ
ncbi:hypothetical protein PVK06_015828 [Gossypium arboreum]|uniref:Uncharacterized protein n=1 Tax=Gossypium arboreum TaxID=29729 RepID=A0ABR0PYB7_GOSAR|nr:hypothetical protein PVK06_015828 [Gossypium arboreum]